VPETAFAEESPERILEAVIFIASFVEIRELQLGLLRRQGCSFN
jgi:hypothetical protein